MLVVFLEYFHFLDQLANDANASSPNKQFATADRAGQRDPDMDVDFPSRCGFRVTELGA